MQNYKFRYQTRGKDKTKLNIYACKLHLNCQQEMKVTHSSDNFKVLQRERLPVTWSSPHQLVYSRDKPQRADYGSKFALLEYDDFVRSHHIQSLSKHDVFCKVPSVVIEDGA